MNTVVHTCTQGTYACDYHEGEAVKTRRDYDPPRVEVLLVRIEKGYRSSGVCQGMTEGLADGGCIDFGSPDPYYPDGSPMTEGIRQGRTIFF